MKIIYINWKCFGTEDILATFDKLGYEYSVLELSKPAYETGYDEKFSDELVKKIKSENANLLVSFNYYPAISVAAMKCGIRYFAWIYDNPYVKVYDSSITNNANYVGSFDSEMVGELNSKGVGTVHYVPLAVNFDRIKDKLVKRNNLRRQDIINDHPDIAMVGGLYDEKHNFYDRMLANAKSMELAGFLDGVIAAQRLVYGYTFADQCIDESKLKVMGEAVPFDVEKYPFTDLKRIYTDYCLSPKMTSMDRYELLSRLSRSFSVNLYTYDENKRVGNVNNRGKIDYYEDMPIAFNNAKINLNATLRSIRSGIPLRAMDIMGCGGFLLTNYQEDMFRHFEAGKHFDFYSSIDEAVDKATYYLQHEDERRAVAENAFDEIAQNHTYEKRLGELLPQLV